ncbi:MAG TPA: rhomboid family intramembrane serine protease [Polyangia bacterium]|jgi:membrane associated rhomboid family serine protease|nr:rhomboid family intramembrane serine protease [Polyangia bacterium]
MQWIGARPTPGATGLMVTLVASFLILAFAREETALWFRKYCALHPLEALGPRPWQLVTSWLVQDRFGAVLGDLFGVWIFGTIVEQQVGRRKMLTLFASAQLCGALVIALVGRVLHPWIPGLDIAQTGCGPAVVALTMAFGLLYGDTPLLFFGIAELRGRTLAWLSIGIGIGIAVLNLAWLTLVGDLVGIGVGWLFTTQALSRIERSYQRWRLKRLKRRYKVIPGGRSSANRNYIH